MEKSKNYETLLPKGYVLVRHVDAERDKRLIACYSLLSLVPPIVLCPIYFWIASHVSHCSLWNEMQRASFLPYLITFLAMLAYIVLHELVHGATYKYFTGQKLTYGFSFAVAFCGVPEIYVRRRASLAALVMPFCVFNVLFLALTFILWRVSPLYGFLAGMLLAVHIGGCVGDLDWTFSYLTKFRGCNTLMRDTGPVQWLYIPKEEAEKRG